VTPAPRPVVSDLSVVIPTVGRDLLEGCLRSIAEGSHWPGALLVVDQGSSPAVAGWARRLRAMGLQCEHLPSSETGIAAATNRGLERVQTPFAAVTHDDCRVAGDWVATMAARLASSGMVVLTGRVEPEGEGAISAVKTSPTPVTYTEPLLDGDVLFPPNMGFPMRVPERIGYFDEHPSLRSAGEDNDWAYRALRAGVPIVYDPTVAVRHVAWQRDIGPIYRRYARGQGAFYGKFLRRGDRFIARRAARDLLRGPWLLARGLATRNHDLTAMGRGEVAGILPGILAGMRGRGQETG
jgi:glycosyltransferase involved in cell wall biosynthesis